MGPQLLIDEFRQFNLGQARGLRKWVNCGADSQSFQEGVGIYHGQGYKIICKKQAYNNNMIEEAQLDEHQPEQKQKQPEQQIELKSFNHISLYYTYLQRYYTTYESNHEYVHFHSNGLFIIRPKFAGLPSKPVEIQGLLEPVEVKGKKKRGGVRVKPNTHIAKIKCQNGDIIKIVACVEGTVIEHNTNLKAEDLQKDESYLVIVLPSRRFVPEQNGMKKVTYLGNPLSLT